MVRFFLYSAGIAILLMIAMFAWSIYRSLEAENTLHATDIVIDAFAEFCMENAGRFPASWDELGSARVSSRAGFAWPDDMARIRERVEVDFGGATREFVQKPGWSRKIIRPRPPNYLEAHETHFDALERTVREASNGAN